MMKLTNKDVKIPILVRCGGTHPQSQHSGDEAEGLPVQGQSRLHRNFKATLDHVVTSCFKKLQQMKTIHFKYFLKN